MSRGAASPAAVGLPVGRSRYGISFWLLAGLASLVLLTAAAGGVALAVFATFEGTLNDVVRQYLPSLVSSASLVQETQKLAANAPALMVADSQVVRRGLVTRIDGQRAAIDLKVRQLSQHGLSAEEATTINQVEHDLVENLQNLDSAVERRIDLERQLQNLMQQIRQIRESLRQREATQAESRNASVLARLLDGPGAQHEAVLRLWREQQDFATWSQAVNEIVAQLLTAFEAPNKGRVDAYRQQLLDDFERLLPLGEALPADGRGTAKEISQALHEVALGETGLLDTRSRQLDAMRDQQFVLDRNRLLAGRLSNAVDAPRRRLEQDVLDISAVANDHMHDAARRLVVILLICLVAAGGIVFYINRRVVRRLRGLQNSMHSHIVGQPVPIDTRGDDEIGDMGMALDFFVRAISAREEALHQAKAEAEQALVELKTAQISLVQAEKLASLGQLTAGIAHEIKNPLNFIINFSSLSLELLDELTVDLDQGNRQGIDETLPVLRKNLTSIQTNGTRADGILRSMLLHSRSGGGARLPSDVNRLLEDAFNLSFHGVRVQDESFDMDIDWQLDRTIGLLPIVPQDIMRVFVNLISNAFYATTKRREEAGPDYRPQLRITSIEHEDCVEVNIADNGVGIDPQIRDKLFTPFFTTKLPGEGTGLGLSLSWDMVVHGHGGSITVDSKVNDYTIFTVKLPRQAKPPLTEGSPGGFAAGKAGEQALQR